MGGGGVGCGGGTGIGVGAGGVGGTGAGVGVGVGVGTGGGGVGFAITAGGGGGVVGVGIGAGVDTPELDFTAEETCVDGAGGGTGGSGAVFFVEDVVLATVGVFLLDPIFCPFAISTADVFSPPCEATSFDSFCGTTRSFCTKEGVSLAVVRLGFVEDANRLFTKKSATTRRNEELAVVDSTSKSGTS